MKTLITVTGVADPGKDPLIVKAAVTTAVMDVVQKNYVENAQKLQTVLREHKELGAIRVPKHAAKSCRYPGTRTGLCVVESVLDEVREVRANRLEKEAAEAQRSLLADEARGKKQHELSVCKQKFVDAVQSGDTSWKTEMKVDELKLVYKSLGGVVSKLKRDELRVAIQELLTEM